MPALDHSRSAPTGHPQGDAPTDSITHPFLNTMNFKQIVTSIAISTIVATPVFTPTQAHAMTGEEAFKFIQVIGEYMQKLDNIFKPAPPTSQPSATGGEDNQSEPDLNEIQTY
jgi:hypothetical protein